MMAVSGSCGTTETGPANKSEVISTVIHSEVLTSYSTFLVNSNRNAKIYSFSPPSTILYLHAPAVMPVDLFRVGRGPARCPVPFGSRIQSHPEVTSYPYVFHVHELVMRSSTGPNRSNRHMYSASIENPKDRILEAPPNR